MSKNLIETIELLENFQQHVKDATKLFGKPFVQSSVHKTWKSKSTGATLVVSKLYPNQLEIKNPSQDLQDALNIKAHPQDNIMKVPASYLSKFSAMSVVMKKAF